MDPTEAAGLGPLSDDAFLGGRLRLWQPVAGYRAATDPVLLAAACPAVTGQSVLDLGCGAGAAGLCLAARVPGIALAGLEVQAGYAALARANAARNGIAFEVHEGDVAAATILMLPIACFNCLAAAKKRGAMYWISDFRLPGRMASTESPSRSPSFWRAALLSGCMGMTEASGWPT